MRRDLEDLMDDLTNGMRMLRPVTRGVPDSVRLKSAHDRVTRDAAVLVLVLDEASRSYCEDERE